MKFEEVKVGNRVIYTHTWEPFAPKLYLKGRQGVISLSTEYFWVKFDNIDLKDLALGTCSDMGADLTVMMSHFDYIGPGRIEKFHVDLSFKSPPVEEWRLWRNDQPGICPCGVSKQVCTYHRG